MLDGQSLAGDKGYGIQHRLDGDGDSTVPKTPDEILAAELKKLAVQAGKTDTGAGVVNWVAKRLPVDAFTVELQFHVSPEVALRAACDLLQEEGQLRDDVELQACAPAVSAVIGSGFMGLNPALVTIEVIPLATEDVKVKVVGTAKEGLIKQRGGEKAAQKIAGRLRQRLVG